MINFILESIYDTQTFRLFSKTNEAYISNDGLVHLRSLSANRILSFLEMIPIKVDELVIGGADSPLLMKWQNKPLIVVDGAYVAGGTSTSMLPQYGHPAYRNPAELAKMVAEMFCDIPIPEITERDVSLVNLHQPLRRSWELIRLERVGRMFIS